MFSNIPNCCSFVAMTTDSVHLVDYEYEGPNFIVFDIANHFCECDWVVTGANSFDLSHFIIVSSKRFIHSL